MNSTKNLSTPQNSQPVIFIRSSELLHTFINVSQPPEQLELGLIQIFFMLVEKTIFEIGKEEKDDWKIELYKSSRNKRRIKRLIEEANTSAFSP